jgi:hypothetical protein
MKIKNIKTALDFTKHVVKNDTRPTTKKVKDVKHIVDLFVTLLKDMK